MGPSQEEPFPFLDLPRELRDEIYFHLLCSISPHATTPTPLPEPHPVIVPLGQSNDLGLHNICQASHSISTSILLTSKQVHREAYDVMVKRNQFISIVVTGIPIGELLISYQIPIVTMDRQHAGQFKGYMLRLHIYRDDESETPCDNENGPEFDFMIFGRDWPLFCKMLSQVDAHRWDAHRRIGYGEEARSIFSGQAMVMELTLKPWDDRRTLPDYKLNIDEFFEAKVQEDILKPFRALREFTKVSVHGDVPRELRDTLVEEVSGNRFLDTSHFLQAFEDHKEKGDADSEDGVLNEAVYHYGEAISAYRSLLRGTSLEFLVEEGGACTCFLNHLAEMYPCLLLNAAETLLEWMQTPDMEANESLRMALGDETMSILYEAMGTNELRRYGCTWRYTDAQQLHYLSLSVLARRLVGRESPL